MYSNNYQTSCLILKQLILLLLQVKLLLRLLAWQRKQFKSMLIITEDHKIKFVVCRC